MKEALELIGGFIILVIIWFVVGGPNHEIAREGVYLHPLAPIDSGTAYGGKYLNETTTTKSDLVLPKPIIDVKKIEQEVSSLTTKTETTQGAQDTSFFSKNLIIDGKGGADATDQNKEYVRLIANTRNPDGVFISGLTLKSGVTNMFGVIPLGILVPIVGQISEGNFISLTPGERAIITTGESPIGSSFKINMCSGYLGQFQEYTPALRLECPFPTDELKNSVLSSDSSCLDFVSTIPRCTAYTGVIPSNLSSSCKSFITRNLTYNGCVENHKTSSNFFGNEWRVFLGKSQELWKSSQEIIKLLDPNGNTVDAITY